MRKCVVHLLLGAMAAAAAAVEDGDEAMNSSISPMQDVQQAMAVVNASVQSGRMEPSPQTPARAFTPIPGYMSTNTPGGAQPVVHTAPAIMNAPVSGRTATGGLPGMNVPVSGRTATGWFPAITQGSEKIRFGT